MILIYIKVTDLKSNEQKMPLSYTRESTSNYDRSVEEIIKSGYVNLRCIHCLNHCKTSDLTNLELIPDMGGYTILCGHCGEDTVIPVVPSSVLYEMNEEDQKEQLKQWRKERFGSREPEDSGYETEDYEKEEADVEVTCMGCMMNQPNQEAHMDIGGCLYCD